MRKLGVILSTLVLIFSLLGPAASAQSPEFEEEFQQYLSDISAIRGFEVTRDDIEMVLSMYDESIEDYDSVQELSDSLGEVIKSDLSNIQFIYEDYALNEESLRSLLAEFGEELEDYIFVGDLEESVFFYTSDEFVDEDMILELLEVFKTEFDLTDEEIERLKNHLISIEDDLLSPETMERLEGLSYRMMAIGEFDETGELSSDQVEELLSIFDELLSIYQVKAEYTLITKDTEKNLTLLELVNMKELINAKLKISIYNLTGDFLADIIITGEMFDSDLIKETGKDITKAAEKVEKVKKPITENKTVKGGKLPNTASNNLIFGVLGLLGILIGTTLFRRVRER
ncbi:MULTISPECIES: processed acidic surface protein [unclassified Cytobacillus]|uniref:processed acidic surface protein n=1 Tax=unclassified Cytobacillus TaxID=2675268 RepID=UPI00203B5EC0|nr:processed acidic surface protein [Cytobacillus sp. AMY 15.2]MCM3090652.1 processed acidic surface protein [Cytobacillus sp. AMY 15.2]